MLFATEAQRSGEIVLEKWPRGRVSEVPILDIQKAQEAAIKAEFLLHEKKSALHTAATLQIYNGMIHHMNSKEEQRLYKRIMRLQKREKEARDRHNPLPSVGIEVELGDEFQQDDTLRPLFTLSPTHIPHPQVLHLVDTYKAFTEAVGLPINRVIPDMIDSVKHAYLESFSWEMSTNPSCSAAVQNTIIAELIHLGFIVHLNKPAVEYRGEARRSRLPKDIHRFISDKLVSLHVNIGIPNSLNWEADHRKENYQHFTNLSEALAIAYTSPLRLRERYRDTVYHVKQEAMVPIKQHSQKRLELLPLEVREESTYRMIENAQILAAGMFAALSARPLSSLEQALAQEWSLLRIQLGQLYLSFGYFGVNQGASSKEGLAEKASLLSRHVEALLDTRALQMRLLLHEHQGTITAA